MKVAEIREEAEWHRLGSVWNRLLDTSASATTFLTWEWTAAWWNAFGTVGDLRILTVTDDTGEIRGIAPLRRQTARRYGQTFETLSFLADGSNDSDYLDFIVSREFEGPVMAALAGHLLAELHHGVIVRLNEIPAGSPNLNLLRHLTASSHIWQEQTVPCATVHLPATWDDYLAALRPRFRTKIRSVLRNLEGRPEVQFGFCSGEKDLERLLPALFDLHTRRWNEDGRPGVFGWDRKRTFYGDLSRRLLEQGSLRFSWLEWKGGVLACQYGFQYRDTYLHLQEGYEPASEHWNVGLGLRAWTIREFLRAGVREYDFLAGVGRHKTDWGADVKESRQVIVAARSARNQLFCRGPEWEQRARETVKTIIPDSLLAVRRARLERRDTTGGPDVGMRAHLRRATARSYFHLGLPAAARLLRERYQVSLAPPGTRRRRSLTRRREPSGRILYYHRVNDERDPFFPSTPTEVFERHIRFVARHYRVVSVSDLLGHLESGGAESVVAITFDDGYRDNYENAFPILQRYGVPATVFLATGSLDSRDPLWFEDLAMALKTTSREFLDVEFDLPRRFWLRSHDERLRSNAEMFALLRRMPDEERRIRLEAILHELASKDMARRRDLMLTWDEVRYMKARSIDFGGHTVTHPYLSRTTREQVTWEVSECKRRIETELQAPVLHFAYPNGREEDFAPWNKEVIRGAGYQAAMTTMWGLNYSSTDRMELRRGGPWEEDEALFAYKLDWYQLVND